MSHQAQKAGQGVFKAIQHVPCFLNHQSSQTTTCGKITTPSISTLFPSFFRKANVPAYELTAQAHNGYPTINISIGTEGETASPRHIAAVVLG